jgi:outer membrane receptor protein involved in Fe transport
MRSKHILSLLLLLSFIPALAQEQGDGLPKLEIENITVVGKRVLTLPKARKGEVIDTSLYWLPAGDTLLFGQRVSNLEGTGGVLPGYHEVVSPLKINYEASLGSYISPRALLQGEYLRKNYDVTGVIDYRGTQGHIDSAKGSSILLGLHGNVVIGGDDPALPKSRISADLEHIGDGYFLYGNRLTPFDRSRAATRFNAGFRNQEDSPVDYAFDVMLANTSVEDRLRDSARNASALTAGINFDLAAGTDSLRGRLRLDYATTSLHYSAPAQTPASISVQLDGEWVPAPGFFLTGGIIYANGQHSDSGSTMLLMPRASIRYELNPTISLFGWFTPSLRVPSYRDLLMRAPYVDREITLRPEKVPVRLAGGIRLSTEPMTLEVRATYESAENTPVVTTDSVPGELRYQYVDSRTVGAEGSLQLNVIPDIAVAADIVLKSAVNTATDRQLPMVPQIDMRGRIDYTMNRKLGFFGSVTFQTAQRTALADTALPANRQEIRARFLLGGGASYKILENLDIFGEVSNLLGYSYELWQNYSAPGLELRGGVRGRF